MDSAWHAKNGGDRGRVKRWRGGAEQQRRGGHPELGVGRRRFSPGLAMVCGVSAGRSDGGAVRSSRGGGSGLKFVSSGGGGIRWRQHSPRYWLI